MSGVDVGASVIDLTDDVPSSGAAGTSTRKRNRSSRSSSRNRSRSRHGQMYDEHHDDAQQDDETPIGADISPDVVDMESIESDSQMMETIIDFEFDITDAMHNVHAYHRNLRKRRREQKEEEAARQRRQNEAAAAATTRARAKSSANETSNSRSMNDAGEMDRGRCAKGTGEDGGALSRKSHRSDGQKESTQIRKEENSRHATGAVHAQNGMKESSSADHQQQFPDESSTEEEVTVVEILDADESTAIHVTRTTKKACMNNEAGGSYSKDHMKKSNKKSAPALNNANESSRQASRQHQQHRPNKSQPAKSSAKPKRQRVKSAASAAAATSMSASRTGPARTFVRMSKKIGDMHSKDGGTNDRAGSGKSSDECNKPKQVDSAKPRSQPPSQHKRDTNKVLAPITIDIDDDADDGHDARSSRLNNRSDTPQAACKSKGSKSKSTKTKIVETVAPERPATRKPTSNHGKPGNPTPKKINVGYPSRQPQVQPLSRLPKREEDPRQQQRQQQQPPQKANIPTLSTSGTTKPSADSQHETAFVILIDDSSDDDDDDDEFDVGNEEADATKDVDSKPRSTPQQYESNKQAKESTERNGGVSPKKPSAKQRPPANTIPAKDAGSKAKVRNRAEQAAANRNAAQPRIFRPNMKMRKRGMPNCVQQRQNQQQQQQSTTQSSAHQERRRQVPPTNPPQWTTAAAAHRATQFRASSQAYPRAHTTTPRQYNTSQTWMNASSRAKRPTRPVNPAFHRKPDFHSYQMSHEEALKMQERMFAEAAARVRSQHSQYQQPSGYQHQNRHHQQQQQQQQQRQQQQHRAGQMPHGSATTKNNQSSSEKRNMTFAAPVIDVANRHPNHWKYTCRFARLGLPVVATSKQVKLHYRKLVLLYHPDKSKSKATVLKFQAITEAYHYILRKRGMR